MKIQLFSLKDGLHEFRVEESAVDLGLPVKSFPHTIRSNILVDKRGRDYYIKLRAETFGRFTCDRCLTIFEREIVGDSTVVFTQDRELVRGNVDESLRFLGPEDNEVDFANDIRETVLLLLPMKQVCREECKGLCPHCGVDLNVETCRCEEKAIDPRWEALLAIKRSARS